MAIDRYACDQGNPILLSFKIKFSVTEIVQFMYLNKGSGNSCNMLDCQGNFGNTALHIAAHCGKIEMTTYLLDKGFDVNKMNELSETPLHLAASGYYSGE